LTGCAVLGLFVYAMTTKNDFGLNYDLFKKIFWIEMACFVYLVLFTPTSFFRFVYTIFGLGVAMIYLVYDL